VDGAARVAAATARRDNEKSIECIITVFQGNVSVRLLDIKERKPVNKLTAIIHHEECRI
jgi:hypothetical protein